MSSGNEYQTGKLKEKHVIKIERSENHITSNQTKTNLVEKELSDKTNEKPVLQVNKSLGLRSQRRQGEEVSYRDDMEIMSPTLLQIVNFEGVVSGEN